MSRKKYIVKSINVDSIGINFIDNFSDKLGNDDFDKAFLLFVKNYDKWIKENGFIVWKKLVDKIKISNFNQVYNQLFQTIYNNLSIKLYWIYKYYRLKIDIAKSTKDGKKIISEFNSNVKTNLFLYNDFDTLTDLIEFDIPMDVKGSYKSKPSNLKYLFILAITKIEFITSKLQSVIKKPTTQMLIKYYQQEPLFDNAKIIDFGSKFYNDYKNRNPKDWNDVFDNLLKLDTDFNDLIPDLMENFYRFIEKKYPNRIIKNPTKDIPIFLFNESANSLSKKNKSKNKHSRKINH